MSLDEDLYQERILDHFEQPFHRGHCPAATHAHEGNNPLCGDVVRLELAVDREGVIQDAYFSGQGCCISQAAASMLVESVTGKRVEELKAFCAKEMLELFGARLTPNRQKCCLLGWRVLQQALHSPVSAGPRTSGAAPGTAS